MAPASATCFIALPVIKDSTRGNAKIGVDVLTESRPTGPTCPNSCPFKATEARLQANSHGAKIPLCYSHDIGVRRPSVAQGTTARYHAWRANRAAWRAKRLKEWRKATAKGAPIRFNVHGDIFKWNKAEIDREWISDIIRVARQIGGFRGWIYTHCWRELQEKTRQAMNRAGIIVWASVHNMVEASQAAALGYRIAYISPMKKKGYTGPKCHREIGTGRPAVVCPEQIGTKPDCQSCGFCFLKTTGPDLVLLTH